MTWEYLIGSEKDFEGAPDWAVMVYKSSVRCFVGLRGQWMNEDSICACSNFERHAAINFGEKLIAKRQPITEPSWDGVGLPPVGCECEALIPHGAGCLWRNVKVICSGDEFKASGEFKAYGEFIVVDLENTHLHWADEFRTLRNNEQIDREDAINEMARIMSGHPTITHEAIADLIFDAGYRKTK